MYRSPTCTAVDKAAGEALAKIAGINVEELAGDMFRAGSNLSSKETSEIFEQDFKTFVMNDITFGVGQVNSMNQEELVELKQRLYPYMEKQLKQSGLQMLFFMLTDIVQESTELLYVGSNAQELIRDAMGVEPRGDSFILRGVVSRKKQLIPAIMTVLQ